jgi:F-box/leucine-rich repeat protein 10/11
MHANRHVPSFLALKECDDVLQILTDGKELTAENLVEGKLSISAPILVVDTPTSIGLKVPKARGGGAVTVRYIADIIGHSYPISVIDVQHQEELEGWTMGDLVDYFEDAEQQLASQALSSPQTTTTSSSTKTIRRRRAAATVAIQKEQVKVLNQISLEFSFTPLRRMVNSPRFVRDMDWIDHAWPCDKREAGDYPVVQYYCLTSMAGSYTDFHVDFGGTAVWYHVLRGEKKFALIEPTKENLQVYEDWLCRSNQAELFLPDLIKGVKLNLTLKEFQTLVIPTGWIHAVYTPVDSVVIGGNFIHGLDISTMLEIYNLETRAHVPGRFRFPHFQPLMFHAGAMYLRKLQEKVFICDKELEGLGDLIAALEGWWKVQVDETLVVAAKQAASGCESVEEFLTLLKLERARRMMEGNEETTEKPKFRFKLASTHDAAVTSDDTSVKPPQLSPPRQANKPGSVRLKMSSPRDSNPSLTISSPRESKPPASLRIKLSPDVRTEAPRDELDFSISVPSSSHYALPKKRKSVQREGLDEYLPSPGDCEWEPEIGRKRASQKAKARTQSKSTVQPKKPKASSRQRLMKRFH